MSAVAKNALPEGLLVAWYGDDFTGSAAVMEVLSFAGLPSVLFLDIPTPRQLARFPDMRGIGIAGTARTCSPDWMEKHLPAVFRHLKSLNAPITHYKVCSTMDSSPRTGSIGKAIDVAQQVLNSKWIPLLFAAPAIRRYQSFGHLFAAAPGGVFRLDRHPVMACHPVTPMAESDVVRHVSHQTNRPVSLVDLEMLADPNTKIRLADTPGEIIAIDTISKTDLIRAGELIWENRGDGLLAAGSQGIEYALVGYWQDTGLLILSNEQKETLDNEKIVVVSGSVSQVTADQINWALQNGFTAVPLDATAVIEGGEVCSETITRVVMEALAVLESGSDPIIYTARGPDDPAVQKFQNAVADLDITASSANNQVGAALGAVLDALLRESGVRRAVISGGDTSGHVMRQLEIYALSALAPTIPGAALFQAHSDNPEYQKLQLGLKGGQMGTPDYFGWIKQGGGAAGKRRLAA